MRLAASRMTTNKVALRIWISPRGRRKGWWYAMLNDEACEGLGLRGRLLARQVEQKSRTTSSTAIGGTDEEKPLRTCNSQFCENQKSHLTSRRPLPLLDQVKFLSSGT